ncbi:MAG: hypothetical protein NVS9B6_00560 [Candidatus Limnocylindrales bacterium]
MVDLHRGRDPDAPARAGLLTRGYHAILSVLMSSGPLPNDDPAALAVQIREAAEKSAAALRERDVPIGLEPPTVFRP